MNKLQIFIIIAGILVALGGLFSFLSNESPFYLFLSTMGILAIIYGIFLKGEAVQETGSYFITMFVLNLLQWFIFIYSYFINNFGTNDIITIAITPIITIYLIYRIIKTHSTLLNKLEFIYINKKKIIFILIGILIIAVSFTSFVQSKSPLAIFGLTMGIMAFAYGYYHQGKKVKLTLNYFLIITIMLILQWLINIYMCINMEIYAKEDVPSAITFAMVITILFYMQIHDKLKINWAGIFFDNQKIW